MIHRAVTTVLLFVMLAILSGCTSPFQLSQTYCRLPAEFPAHAEAAYANGRIYIGGLSGSLYTMNTMTHKVERVTNLNLVGSLIEPQVDGQMLYGLLGYGTNYTLFGLDLASDQVRWQRQVTITPSYPSMHPYVVTPTHIVIAESTVASIYRKSDGTPVGAIATGGSSHIVYDPAAGQIILSGMNRILIVDDATNYRIATIDTDPLKVVALAVQGSRIFAITSDPAQGTTKPVALIAYDRTLENREIWSTPVMTMTSPLLSPDGTVILPEDASYRTLDVLDAQTGNKLWQVASDDLYSFFAETLIDGTSLYIGTQTLHHIDLMKHQVTWSLATRRVAQPIAIEGSTLYIAFGGQHNYRCGMPPDPDDGGIAAIDLTRHVSQWEIDLKNGKTSTNS